MKPTVWHEHVGLKENIELVKITEVCYGLICNMECFVLPWNFFRDLVTIKDTSRTAIFLLIATMCVMWFEIFFPLSILAFAMYMLNLLYRHESYVPRSPNVKDNIVFIKWCSELFSTAKYQFDLFMVDVVYWREPKKSVKLVAWLAVLSLASFLSLTLIGIRMLILLTLYAATAFHSPFFTDLALVVFRVVGDWNLHPAEEYIYL